ncbi:hypothetical protein NQ317_017542 [Molorchus minor]|uniref:Uncharacterized protein n=1 Tax=Molorchus minor TaxID=1323400 RepID=A0ABQ9IQZ4_9CUCU|nr:hypothetical protein NQ317_017542 [Molorchus minor]
MRKQTRDGDARVLSVSEDHLLLSANAQATPPNITKKASEIAFELLFYLLPLMMTCQEIEFFNDDASSQTVVVEKNLCASDLCQLLAMKNRVAKSVHWSIFEYWSDLGLGKLLSCTF